MFKKELIQALEIQREIFGDNYIPFVKFDIGNKSPEQKVQLKLTKSEPKKIQPQEINRISTEEFSKFNSLNDFQDAIQKCQNCSLHETRNKFVFGSGNENAKVMCIGEAPGADEDMQGLPFVGRAGKLLTDILKAISFEREDVYIANILKCRPPKNRDPLPEEMHTCLPYLYKQIELIKPIAILCLGRIAATGLLNQNLSLTQMRGNLFSVAGIPVMVTYHPAALLRNPNWKRGCWEDVQNFRKLYDELIAGKNG